MVAREQFAWVWLLTMLVTYPAYFIAIILMGPMPSIVQILVFGVTAIVQVVIIAVASAVIALQHRQALGRDERDRAIEHRASAFAYNWLICGMILVGCLMPFGHSGWDIFHAAVLVIAVAEILRHGLIVAMYRGGVKEVADSRRGWHG